VILTVIDRLFAALALAEQRGDRVAMHSLVRRIKAAYRQAGVLVD
jgi:hypothetical protein